KRVAVHLICTRFVFAGGPPEGVDGRSDVDIDEADVLEHLLPARPGQPARDSGGPQVDVAQRLRWHRTAVGDVGKLQPPTWPQGTVDLGEDQLLVRAQVDDTVADHDVGPTVLDGQRLCQAFSKLDV